MEDPEYLHKNLSYYKNILILGILGIPIGIAVGVIEVIFGKGLEIVTSLRNAHPLCFIPFLCLAGLVVVYAYRHWGKESDRSMSLVFRTALRLRHVLPLRIIPFSVISTWITHLFGGSAGREGVAVQIGATLSYNLGKKLRIDDAAQTLIVAGMSAGFAGLFETPIAACCFALEVLKVGHLRYRALFPAFTAAITAAEFSSYFGVEKEEFHLRMTMEIDYGQFWILFVIGAIFGIAGALFAEGLHKSKHLLSEKISNPYLRVVIGGIVISVLMILFEQGRYSGSGANLIMAAMKGGDIYWYDFLLKALLTMLTLAIGFQGGEVTPLFTVGSCLGILLGPLFGLDPVVCAALGYAGVFAGGTNTLLAPIFIGGEIFGYDNIPYFAIVCTSAFLLNANKSIYTEQRISYTNEYMNTKSKAGGASWLKK